MIKLSFRAGFVYEDGRELHKIAILVCSKCHITGSLKDIRKYSIQPKILEGELADDLITLNNYKKYDSRWKPYSIDDVLDPAYVVSKYGKSIQKLTGVSYKNSLTESSLGWVCSGRCLEKDNKTFYTPKKESFH